MSSRNSTALNSAEPIASLPLFEGVDTALLREIAVSAHHMQHDKGTVFLAQDQPIVWFHIVLDGWCGAVQGNTDGQASILQIFHCGDFLPEPDTSARMHKSPLNLQALTAVRLLRLSSEIVHNALDCSRAFAANMLSMSIKRCQELRDHIEQLTLHSAEQRVGRFLLQMRLDTNADSDDIVLPFDKSFIAAYLGVKPETFSRILQSFKKKGFLVERNHLTLPDHQALCGYCGSITLQSCRFGHTINCPERTHNDNLIK